MYIPKDVCKVDTKFCQSTLAHNTEQRKLMHHEINTLKLTLGCTDVKYQGKECQQ